MNIGFFVRNFSGGGAEYVTVMLANEMARKGINVTFFVLSSKGPHRDKLSDSVNLVELPVSRLIFSGFSLRSAVLDNGIDVLISNMTHENIVAISSLLGTKVRVIAVEHNNYVKEMGRRGMLVYCITNFLVRILYPKLNTLICVSNGVADAFKSRLGNKLKNIIAIYNPVSIVDEGNDKSFLGSYIVGAGRLVEQKNFALLIEAYKVLVDKYNYSGKLVILGEGEEKENLLLLVRKLGVSDRVLFEGFVSDTSAYFRSADAFVLSSLWEGFGNVIVEALLTGCKVISTNCEYGPSEILCDGKYGALAKLFTADDLAAAINKELHCDRSTDELIGRGSDFSLDSISDQYLEVLR